MPDAALTSPEATCPDATINMSVDFLARRQLSALCPLHGRITFSQPLSSEVTLEVRVAGNSERFTIAPADCQPQDDGGSYHDYLLVLNTFLLGNGPQTVQLTLLDVAGSKVAREVTVDNASDLGRLAANTIANYPGRRWIWREGEVDSTHFPIYEPSLTPWFDRADAEQKAPKLAAQSGLTAAEADALTDFVRQGFCTLPDPVDTSLLDRINADLDAMLERGDIRIADEGEDHRIELVHEKSDAARELWTLPSVMRFLQAIFQEHVLPCQTLVFIRGSGQDMHQDTIHLTAFPAGYMCGVWIALEDVDEDAGPLFVYPGSHRLPRLYCETVGMGKVHNGDWAEFAEKFLPRLERELEDAGCVKQAYLPRKGDILVWHENLAHGGMMRNDNTLSRRSIVSHYFSEGAAVWYDSSGQCGKTRAAQPSEQRGTLGAVQQVAHAALNGSRWLSRLRALWRTRDH